MRRRRRRASEGAHPLLGLRRDARGGEVSFETDLVATDPEWLGDHRVFGEVVAPGALYAVQGIEALRARGSGRSVVLSEFRIHRPLLFTGDEVRTVQVTLERMAPGPPASGAEDRFEVTSRGFETGKDWDLHAEGRLEFGAGAGEVVDVEALGAGLTRVDLQDLYRRMAALGISYGPVFRGLLGLMAGVGEAVGEVALPEGLSGWDGMVHPALLDACFQTVGGLWMSEDGEDGEDGEVWLPVGWDRLWLREGLPERVLCHAQSHEEEGAAGPGPGPGPGEVRRADLVLCSEAGEVVGGVEGFRLRRATREALLSASASVDGMLYRLEWRESERESGWEEHEDGAVIGDVAGETGNVVVAVPGRGPGEVREAAGVWVVWPGARGADPGESLGEAVVRELESRGQEVVTLSGGAPGAPRLRASWRELFAGLPDSRPLRGVVHVGDPVEEAGGVLAERTPASLAADVEEMAGSALALAQGLGDAGVRPELGLSFVTRGGQLLERESGGGLASSVLWGFGRSLARESGELGVRLLDVDSGAVSAGVLAEELLHPDGEPEVLYRGATRRVARLARVPSSAEGGIREAVRNDRSYLVTGGLGGIGLEVAGWLAERGAGAIVLNGRRAPDAGAAAAVEALKERGVEVRVELADVTDEAAVRDLLHRVDAELPPLGGVIHSVGVLSDAAVENQDWGRFEEVLWPKVLGAWNVHRATLDRELDLFVLFSSLSGVLGNAGQANYAAANAFLDQLALRRRALGLPGQAIAWGAWSAVGEAEEQRERLAGRLAAAGAGWMTPAQGLAALDRLVREDVGTSAAALVDWETGALSGPLFADLVLEGSARGQGAPSGDLLSRLGPAAGAEREELVVGFLREEVQSVLHLGSPPPAEVGFFELGMDSLMSVELRNRLQRALGGEVRVSNTAVLDHPDISRLARYLVGLVDGVGPTAPVVRLPAVRSRGEERIAVVGMAGRLPGGPDLSGFWRSLAAGADLVTQGRPDGLMTDVAPGEAGPWGAYVEGLDRFDAEFFRIAPVEAELMDPQQRLLLEVSWEALEDAGLDPGSLRGSRTGVYAGMMTRDYEQLLPFGEGEAGRGAYLATGSGFAATVGRVSFALGLEGPAITVDTACSSSLVAVHQAAAALRLGEADLALAGGMNAILLGAHDPGFHGGGDAVAGRSVQDVRCVGKRVCARGGVRGGGAEAVVGRGA